eukprot:3941202-Rhodomonas_salina.1
MGSFDDASKHELACAFNPSNIAAQVARGLPAGTTVSAVSSIAPVSAYPGKIFDCDFRCGFVGGFEQTSAHEKTCPLNPENEGVTKPAQRPSNLRQFDAALYATCLFPRSAAADTDTA